MITRRALTHGSCLRYGRWAGYWGLSMVNHKSMWRLVGASLSLCVLVSVSLGTNAALAVTLSGVARVIDGDTLDLDGTRIRLFGIDAPEHNQTCSDARGKKWDCGSFATQSLRALAKGNLRCEPLDQDRYGRTVARCFNSQQDINAQMVAQGAAFAYRKYSKDYVTIEARAEARAWGFGPVRPSAPIAPRPASRGGNTAVASSNEGLPDQGNIRNPAISTTCRIRSFTPRPRSTRRRASVGSAPRPKPARRDGGGQNAKRSSA